MPITKEKSWITGNTYYEVECSKCGHRTKVVSGGRKYATDVLARHNREAHGKGK